MVQTFPEMKLKHANMPDKEQKQKAQDHKQNADGLEIGNGLDIRMS
jgi:hypothetical protein